MENSKILVIDDDPALCQLLKMSFGRAGGSVIVANDGQQGLALLQHANPDLIILDIQMPNMSGWETCREIRQLSTVPIIMLTALRADGDIIRGLELGADDFVSKPFNPSVLVARAEAALRSQARRGGGQPSILSHNQFCIDVDQRRVTVDGRVVKLTPKEFKLLTYLVQNTGRLLTFDQILDHVWGWQYEGSMDYVHVYVSHLRRKLGDDPRQPRYIVSEHGVGYRFDPSPS
jgi:two-component system, OmpR family, KDP operon response regulator KdpE